jgi:hypothetical protein
MAKYALLVTKWAGLETQFGLEWATKLFGAEAIASLPIRAAGKNKGKPKGFVIWRKAGVPGWSPEVSTPLAEGQLADAWIGAGAFSLRSNALVGQWAGRMQPLAGCTDVLFGKAEARAAEEKARFDREIAEIRAEAAMAKLDDPNAILSCGCCRGPDNDRCCHIHQDVSRGLWAHKCSRHAA